MWKSHKYVGRCIYCDSTENLSREHVIPQGLGGAVALTGYHEAMVLGDASCETCRRITHSFETEIQHKMMGHFRAATGLMSKRSQRPTRQIKLVGVDGQESSEEVDVSDIPATLLLPVFQNAGFLEGKLPDGHTRMALKTIVTQPGSLRITPGIKATVAGLDPLQYSRMLAKIALGFNVWMIGLDAFEPMVRRFIRGEANEELGHWIGGAPDEPIDGAVLHDLRHSFTPYRGATYASARIRLFALWGGPSYDVIVGEDKPGC